MNKKYVIGVDVGGTNTKIAIVGPDGRIYGKKVFPTKSFPQKDKLINALIAGLKAIISEHKLNKNQILGIGIGTPGLIDSRRGVIHCLVNIKGFKEVPLKRIIENRLHIPAFLDNDVNIMSLGELHYGGGKGARNIVCLTLGTGIGGGIIIEKNLYRGSSLSAGEVGHMTINENGPSCNCGNRGCLEVYAGNANIVKSALKKMRGTRNGLIYKLAGGKPAAVTPKIISEAARKGDKVAKAVLEDAGYHIGVGLANIVNVLNPDRIIIGGGMAEAGKILFDAIKSSMRNRAMKVPAEAVRITKAKLGEDAALIGAMALVKERLKC